MTNEMAAANHGPFLCWSESQAHERVPYWTRCLVVFVVLSAIITTFAINFFAASVAGERPDMTLKCNSVMQWKIAQKCGIDAQNCIPFSTDQSFSARCPAGCQSAYQVLSPIGSSPYRADSGICLAAVHRGLVGNLGGCFRLRMVGTTEYFPASERNGVQTKEFLAPFPISYELEPAEDSEFCADVGFLLLPLMLIGMFSLIAMGVSELLFWITLISFGAIYSSGPVTRSIDPAEFADILLKGGTAMVGFAWLLWDHGGYHQLQHTISRTPVQIAFFYVVPFFVTCNLDFISVIDRSLNFDLDHTFRITTPAMISFLLFMIMAVSAGFAYLIARIHSAGLLKKTIRSYAIVLAPIAIIIAVLAPMVPSPVPHFHHYAVGLLFWALLAAPLPPTRWTHLIQSILLGLIVNGVVRWGLASPLDSTSSFKNTFDHEWLLKPELNSTLIPNSNLAANSTEATVTVAWNPNPYADRTTYSLQFNSIEVYRGQWTNFTIRSVGIATKYRHSLCVVQIQPNPSSCSDAMTTFRFDSDGSLIVNSNSPEIH